MSPVNCRNCGATLGGRFCSECGQEDRELDLSLREFVSEILGNLVSFDSRVWRTLVPLLVRPGDLTARYLAGQRVRFVPPVRLYLFVSILHFLLLAWLGPQGDFTLQADASDAAAVTVEEIQAMDVPEPLQRILQDPAGFRRTFLRGLSYLMFFLLPAFAGLLKVVYAGRGRPHLHHLVFAVHIHAFVFILLSVGVLLEASGAPLLEGLAELLSLIVPVYLFLALLRVYGGRWWTTALRTAFLSVSYGLVLALGVAALAGFLVFIWPL